MADIFQVSDEEKNRIRNLHLTEEANKKLSSVLNEQDIDITVDPVGIDPKGPKNDAPLKEPTTDEDGAAPSVLPVSYHAWRWCHSGGPRVFYLPPQQYGIQGSALQQESTTFYNLMGSPAVGEIIHITFNSDLPQRRMCYEYLGLLIRTTALDNSATAFPSGGSGPVRDPGSWSTCQECEQASTGPIGYCVNCKQGVMSYYPGLGNTTQCPQGFADIGPHPNPPGGGPCVECQGQGNCTPCGWCYGQNHFNSMPDCQNSPSCSGQLWECISPGNCQQTPNGTFATQNDCLTSPGCQQLEYCQCCQGGNPLSMSTQVPIGTCGTYNFGAQFTNCQPTPPGGGVISCQQNNWLCNPNTGCSQDPSGTHPDQTTCETACCAQSITSWAWQPYANGNATCHQICTKLNTSAMVLAAAGNPLNFKHKCRYDWLIAQFNSLGCQPCSSSNGCCDNPGYMSATMAAQYQVSSDPHCVSTTTNFIQDVTDAMNGNNAQNTPYGCTYLYQKQQNIMGTINSGTSPGALCNKQGRIAWLDEIMSTGTAPGFTPNLTTMTALYPGGTFTIC